MAGRPPFFNTPEELEEKVDSYFFEKTNGNVTITGLAYYLGFESRQSFYDYEKHEQYSYIIKRARLFVESEYENKLVGGKPVGAIFALKNMGWKDKHEVEQSGALKVDFSGIQILKPDDPNPQV